MSKSWASQAPVRIWDVRTGEPATPLMRHVGQFTKSGFTRDGSHLMVAAGNQVYLWPVSMPRHEMVVVSPESVPATTRFSRARARARAPSQPTTLARVSPDGKTLVTLWASRTRGPSRGPTRGGAFGPLGRTLDVTLWNADTGERIHAPIHVQASGSPRRRFQSVDPIFSQDGQRVLLTGSAIEGDTNNTSPSDTTTFKRIIRVLDVATGKDVAIEAMDDRSIIGSGFGADGSIVWTTDAADAPDTLFTRIWDAQTGEPLGPPVEHARPSTGRSVFRAADRLASAQAR